MDTNPLSLEGPQGLVFILLALPAIVAMTWRGVQEACRWWRQIRQLDELPELPEAETHRPTTRAEIKDRFNVPLSARPRAR